jgi:hypothetical protein
VTDLIDLIERATWAEAASRRARARCNDAPAHIGADLYVMCTYAVDGGWAFEVPHSKFGYGYLSL